MRKQYEAELWWEGRQGVLGRLGGPHDKPRSHCSVHPDWLDTCGR